MSCASATDQCAPLYVGDYGHAYQVTITDCNDGTAVDLSSASKTNIIFVKPSGVELTVEATVLDGPNGVMQYIFQDGDLDEAGYWQAQGDIETPNIVGLTTPWEIEVRNGISSS